MAASGSDRTIESKSSKPLVIVVDDDRSIVEGLTILLDGWGYETVTALSAAALEQQLPGLARTPNLIIADHYLPAGRTGREVVELLRSRTGVEIPAIILTGDSTAARRDEAELLGCQLLLKPVQVGPLREAVESLSRR
ncbi:response regulator [Azospirillum picis]|uniref:CheY-like chemotaxis protein n=1 Tax=Azospirillum picis TaxID=488438 RepID=A0ABU0MK81_9PROT|nr:response regulator [Azospirillum picis]MBP2299955.1 CheY-like chemotaxis protein [Azospirillum picis]MDQ0533807.1 CheY-like chemotaxis protein [Azospirillum picis]